MELLLLSVWTLVVAAICTMDEATAQKLLFLSWFALAVVAVLPLFGL